MTWLLRIAVLLASVTPVLSHHAPSGWLYPGECCGSGDCAPLAPGAVKWTAGGWLIVETGEVVAFENAQESGDHDWHRCRMKQSDPASATRNAWHGKRCLYVPEVEG